MARQTVVSEWRVKVASWKNWKSKWFLSVNSHEENVKFILQSTETEKMPNWCWNEIEIVKWDNRNKNKLFIFSFLYFFFPFWIPIDKTWRKSINLNGSAKKSFCLLNFFFFSPPSFCLYFMKLSQWVAKKKEKKNAIEMEEKRRRKINWGWK